MLNIFYGGPNNPTHLSLLAAQCVTLRNSTVERRPDDLKIVYGDADSHPVRNYVDVEKIVLHQEYDATTLSNNMAMIWLKRVRLKCGKIQTFQI